MLKPVVGAGSGLASFCWFRGRTVSNCLVVVGADVIASFSVDVALGLSVTVSIGAAAGVRF